MFKLNPKTISVPLNKDSYPIWIQRGIINYIWELLAPLNKNQKCVHHRLQKIDHKRCSPLQVLHNIIANYSIVNSKFENIKGQI